MSSGRLGILNVLAVFSLAIDVLEPMETTVAGVATPAEPDGSAILADTVSHHGSQSLTSAALKSHLAEISTPG